MANISKIKIGSTTYTVNDSTKIPLSGSTAISGNLQFSRTGLSIIGIDKTGFAYPYANDNGSNLWIGATATVAKHHTGSTYISAGHNGTTGNSTIYISIPNDANDNATNKAVCHSGNTSFTRNLTSGTKIGTITIAGTATDLYCEANTNTNYYPTAWAWTAGTTAGPTAKITGSGMSAISVAAIPTATASASGIVTTGAQTFAGNKTFTGTNLIIDTSSSDANRNIQYKTSTRTGSAISFIPGDANGSGIRIGDGGLVVVGAGESASAYISNESLAATAESLHLTSDSSITFATNCNTIANRAKVILNGSKAFYPDTTNTGSLGTSSYQWANTYSTNIYTANIYSAAPSLGEPEIKIASSAGSMDYIRLAPSGSYFRNSGGGVFLQRYDSKVTSEISILAGDCIRITSNSSTSQMQIKANAWPTGSGTVAHISSSGTLIKYSSSLRYKNNIDYDIDKEDYHNQLMQFKPCTFEYNEIPYEENLGLIAEDVYEVNPQLINYNDNFEIESFRDRDLLTMLIIEAQEKDKKIKILEERLAALENLNNIWN